MIRHRSREHVMRDILDATMGDGATITRIMFKVGLTTDQFNDYMSYMMEKGLVTVEVSKRSQARRYHATAKGILFLKMVNAISELLKKT
jgi:predicted transcriptional regulator